MLWQIFLGLLLIYGMIVRWKRRKLNEIHEKLPIKLKSVPILGHAVHFMRDAQERTKNLQRVGIEAIDHGGISSFWLAYKLLVVIADAEAAEVVLKACLEKDDMMNIVRPLIGNGSIMAPVKIWRPRRKLLAPTLTQRTLNNFVNVFSNQATLLMDQLDKHVGNGNFSIFESIAKYSMGSTCETAFGIQVNTLENSNHPVQKSFNHFCRLSASRVMQPWLYSDATYRWTSDYSKFYANCSFLKKYVSQKIKEKRESMSKEDNNLRDTHQSNSQEEASKTSFLELLMEAKNGKGFSDLEIQEETLVMLLAGTDTSATAAAFAALLLAKHTDIQEKVYQEGKSVFGDSKRNITPNDWPKLKYLDAVVKETLRLYPSAPIIVRKVEKDVTLPSGLTLVQGVGVLIHIWATQRNPKYWGSDANVFRPERFLESSLSHPCAFIPFSSGLRNCIGAQFAMTSIKTVLTRLVQRYRLLPPTSTNNTTGAEGELRVNFDIIMKHADNFELQLEFRDT